MWQESWLSFFLFFFFKVEIVYKLHLPAIFFFKCSLQKSIQNIWGKKYKDETQPWTHSYAHPQKGLEMLKRTLKGDSQPWLRIRSPGSVVGTDARALPQAIGLDSRVTGSVGLGGGAGPADGLQ